ncbi:phage protein [Micromonospora sp. M42]|nr:phage protein [Micromonospora sp. M42]
MARARAFTRAAVYSFARPGEVEVVLVPYVPEAARPGGRLPVAVLREHEVEEARRRVEADLERRRALGTAVRAGWARYKAVSIRARVVVRREEDVDAVRRRIHDRLHQTLSPLPTPLNPAGWAFGEPLRASNVYRMLEHAEPGVRYVESVRFVVDEAPDAQVRTVAVDQYQADTWYAGGGPVLFRSTNAGAGWEPAGRFDDETVVRVVPAPAPVRPGVVPRAGSVAVVTARAAGGSRVRLSTDLGETWTLLTDLDSGVRDLAWIDRDGTGALLLATDAGLYEVPLLPGAVPLQILVDPADADRGFYAVRAFVSERGAPGVAVAAQAGFGVYLSTSAGRPGTFAHVGLANVDNRILAVQYDGPGHAAVVRRGRAGPEEARPGLPPHPAVRVGREVAVDGVRLDRRHLPRPGVQRPARARRDAERRRGPPRHARRAAAVVARDGQLRPAAAGPDPVRPGRRHRRHRAHRHLRRRAAGARRRRARRVPQRRRRGLDGERQPGHRRRGHRPRHLAALLRRARHRGGAAGCAERRLSGCCRPRTSGPPARAACWARCWT